MSTSRPGPGGEAAIRVEAATIGHGRRPLFEGLTFSVERGDFLALVGPNGAGKTTALRTVAGILPPLRGRVIRAADITIGYVPQERDLDPVFPLSALDVALQGRLAPGRAGWRLGAADREAARDALARAGVAELGALRFHELSGGQKQRVLIARGLASGATLLVLDEPTSGMDPPGERALMDLLRALHAERGLAVAMASHHLGVVANYARRIALVDHERRLFEIGGDAEMLTDATLGRLYAARVRVRTVEGRRTVLTGDD
jgi:ABC-type Mn2+/Zn2+ transport system ATPase subunit